MKEFQIYTDGSCLHNPGPGGWAYVIMEGDNGWKASGSAANTTNNRMEMQAIVEAAKKLATLADTGRATTFSDSRLVLNSLTKGWKRKSNLDIWAEMDKALAALKDAGWEMNWQWVKGHAGNKYNEIVDDMAQEAARERRDKSKENREERGENREERDKPSTKGVQMGLGLEEDNNELRTKIEETRFNCARCGSTTHGVLSRKTPTGPIRVDCAGCGKYIKFAKQT